jgi:hypothetical protein
VIVRYAAITAASSAQDAAPVTSNGTPRRRLYQLDVLGGRPTPTAKAIEIERANRVKYAHVHHKAGVDQSERPHA